MKTQMRGKKLLSLCLALVLVLALLPGGVLAANYVGSGDCGLYGGNLRWSLSSDGLLYIQGDGPMANYSAAYRAPWDDLRSTIKNVQFQDSVSNIGDYAFADCDGLTYITLPSRMTGIGSYAFAGCTNLPEIQIPETVKSIGSYAFKDCTTLGINLRYISIPAGVSMISDGMFSGCTNLSYVGIQGATAIGSEAFKGCTALLNPTLPARLTFIGSRAFQGCINLTRMDIPAGVTTIGDYAFGGCTKLATVTLPAGLTAIGDYAFYGCSAIPSLIFPAGLASIGNYAFWGCTRMLELTLPANLSNLGKYAFADCTGLATVVIPEGITLIPESVFNGCISLSILYLPKSLAEVEVNAFANCGTIGNIYYDGLRADWEKIRIGAGNASLTYAGIHADDDPAMPKIPVMLGATVTPGRVTVSWQASADAQKYQVLRKAGSNGVWQPVNETVKLTFTDLTAYAGVTYFYTVRAYTIMGWGDYDPVGVQATAEAVVPLSVTAVTPDKTSAGVGDTITWTASAQGNMGVIEYNFWLYLNGANIKTGTYSTANTFSYVPTAVGAYSVKVYARYVGSTDGVLQSREGGIVNVTAAAPAAPLSVTGITADKTAANIGDTLTWTAAATGGSGALSYCFYVYKDGTAVYKGSYGAARTVSWKITEAGTYTAKVFVKDGAGKSAGKLSAGVTVSAPAAPLSVTGITADKTAANVGATLTWTAAATGGTGTLRYCFYVYKDGAVVQKGGYGAAKTVSYTAAEPGTYTAKVFVRDGSGTTVNRLSAGVAVTGPVAPLAITGITVDKTNAGIGDTLTWTAAASGGTGTLRYCFYVYKDGATVLKSGYGAAKTFSYTVTEPGTYTAKVFVRDGSGQTVSKMSGAAVGSSTQPLAITRVTADKTGANVGDAVTWTAAVTGGSGTLRFCFYVYKDGVNVHKSGYTTAKTFRYTVGDAGSYTVKVFAKDNTGKVVTMMSGKLTVMITAR